MADWQQVIALALVALAAAYLTRSLWGRSTGAGPGACGGCRACDEPTDRGLGGKLPQVDVETLVASEKESDPSV